MSRKVSISLSTVFRGIINSGVIISNNLSSVINTVSNFWAFHQFYLSFWTPKIYKPSRLPCIEKNSYLNIFQTTANREPILNTKSYVHNTSKLLKYEGNLRKLRSDVPSLVVIHFPCKYFGLFVKMMYFWTDIEYG